MIVETHGASQRAELRYALTRLYLRRQLWRFLTRVAILLSALLTPLLILAIADYPWMFRRTVRAAFVAPLLVWSLVYLLYLLWNLIRRRTMVAMAREVERAAGSEQNALVTFAETVEGVPASSAPLPYMLARLERQASAELASFDEKVIAPRGGAVRGLCALIFILLVVLAVRAASPVAFTREVRRVLWLASDAEFSSRLDPDAASEGMSSKSIVIEELRVRVVPPAYTGMSAEEASSSGPVRALSGSQIEVRLRARGSVDGAALSFNGESNSMRALGDGQFVGNFIASASGAFETRILADETLARPAAVVRAVEVDTDAPPEVRISEPASDQLLRSLPDKPMSVRWTARDDLGLETATLKYIKSRGAGDAAKFTSGDVAPAQFERANAREWNGTATLDLARLNVQPGDTLVFWMEARDRNPSANNTGRSASLAIAIAGPEGVRLNLSDLRPNTIGRFLLSQRQIIINTEKLDKVRAGLAREELLKRANAIAADQREFKNSFNDYIKIEGAGEDEGGSATGGTQTSIEEQAQASTDEQTKPQDHGIPDPPADSPASVKEMVYAIRAMWDAEDALTTGDTVKALSYEREALARLKRAQTAARYVPPIVAQSRPIDLKRRYAGELAEIKSRLEKLARRPASKEGTALRAALGDLYAALGDLQGTLDVPVTARASALGRARERARAAADRLVSVGGDHAATVAEAAGQLRVVETELASIDAGGSADQFAQRLSKPLALLTQAASNLFAIAESSTRAANGDTPSQLPVDDARAADYFRRLAQGAP